MIGQRGNRNICCNTEDSDSFGDCQNRGTGDGPAYQHVLNFANNEEAFISAYIEAWEEATTNGYTNEALWSIVEGG